jgi:hypothetical protein
MRIIAIVCAALALASCSDIGGTGVGGSVFTPTAAVTAIVSPQVLIVAPITTSACAFVPPFDTDFSLIVSAGFESLTVDSVTLQLIDGSHVGGPMVTFPQPDLQRMFGSLVVVDTRTFAFRPRFGCGSIQPQSLFVEMLAIGKTGGMRRLTATARFR